MEPMDTGFYIPGGYYMKARCIRESKISLAPPHVREIWDYLLREANHANTKVCERGQLVRSYKNIQEALKWYVGWRCHRYTKDQCETAMKWLKKATMITTRKTTRGMVITICNYDKYQNPENYDSHTENETRTTRKPQTRHTINKNDKNEKNKNTGFRDSNIQTVVEYYKKINGYDKQSDWDKHHFRRYVSAAKSLFEMAPDDWKQAIDWVKEQGYNWTLETVIKKLPDFRQAKSKSEQQTYGEPLQIIG